MEQLYMLEILIEKIRFTSSIIHIPNLQELKFRIVFAHLINLDIDLNDIRGFKIDQDPFQRNITLNVGKSIVFSCKLADLLSALSECPLQLQLKTNFSIGSVDIPWATNFIEILDLGSKSNAQAVIKNTFDIMGENEEKVADIDLFIRLSSHGQNMQTDFQVVSQNNVLDDGGPINKYFFKTVNTSTLFKAQTFGDKDDNPREIQLIAAMCGLADSRTFLQGDSVKPEDLSMQKLTKVLCENKNCPGAQKFAEFGIGPAATGAGMGTLYNITDSTDMPITYGVSNTYGTIDNYGPFGLYIRPTELDTSSRECNKEPDDLSCHCLSLRLKGGKQESNKNIRQRIDACRCFSKSNINSCHCLPLRLKGGGLSNVDTAKPSITESNTNACQCLPSRLKIDLPENRDHVKPQAMMMCKHFFKLYNIRCHCLVLRVKCSKSENNNGLHPPYACAHLLEFCNRRCQCLPLRLKGGGPENDNNARPQPMVMCKDLMQSFDKVLEAYKKALGPCGQGTCPFAYNVLDDSCKKFCQGSSSLNMSGMTPTEMVVSNTPAIDPNTISACGTPSCPFSRPQSLSVETSFQQNQIKSACGRSTCPYTRQKLGSCNEENVIETQFIDGNCQPCGSKCSQAMSGLSPLKPLDPIHWDCPDPLPKGPCRNPQCPLKPKELRYKPTGPCGGPSCPYTAPDPCSDPNCPFVLPCPISCSSPPCMSSCPPPPCPLSCSPPPPMPPCLYPCAPIIKCCQNLVCPTNPPTCGDPTCALNPAPKPCPAMLTCLLQQPCPPSPCVLLPQDNDICTNPDCPLNQQQSDSSSICENPDCPFNNICLNLECPLRLTTGDGGSICSNPECPVRLKPKDSLCSNPDCPLRQKESICANPQCPLRQLVGMGDKESLCSNPQCPFAKESVCSNPQCPFRKPSICSNPECPAQKSSEIANKGSVCSNPQCPFRKPSVCSNPECPSRMPSVCSNPECPFQNTVMSEKGSVCSNPQCPFRKPSICSNPDCPFRKPSVCSNPECPFRKSGESFCSNPQCPFRKPSVCSNPECPFRKPSVCSNPDCPFKKESICSNPQCPFQNEVEAVCSNPTCPFATGKADSSSICSNPLCPFKEETKGKGEHPCEVGKKSLEKKGKKNSLTRKSKKYKYKLGDLYPGMHIGHRECILPGQNVPAKMGWAWNVHVPCVGLKPRRGWRPGAVARKVANMILAHRRAKGLELLEPLALPKTKKSKRKLGGGSGSDSETDTTVAPKPTLQVKKRDGAYLITMNPLKDPNTLEDNESPYMDCSPLQFKITKNKDECKDDSRMCFCDEEEESSSDSELDIEFTPPAGIIRPDRFKKPKDMIHADTQYDVGDFGPPKAESSSGKIRKSSKRKK